MATVSMFDQPIIVSGVTSLAEQLRRPVQFMTALFVSLVCRTRIAIHNVSELTQRCFAEYARVPYQGPMGRQHWEELWEMEASPEPCES
jgi:hypothetical protein